MLLAMNEYNKCCFAKHAEKGKKYYCRGCRKRVILKKERKNVLILPIKNQITVRSLVKENQKSTYS